MGAVLAIAVSTKATAVLIFTGVVAPLIGLGLWKLTGGRDAYGGGAFAILRDTPRRRRDPHGEVDPAIQAAEVRQMLAAKAERQKVRGEPVLDVEAESARLLAAADESPPAARDEELRTEVRQLVVARNERRRRAGLEPLDVETETERQLADLSG
ncbi:MAG TPA: hypothetical protein VMF55_09910 [Solirubrobacterales bacterium]|nr:hypothetical protein [Solirubrobacterales bacterium]